MNRIRLVAVVAGAFDALSLALILACGSADHSDHVQTTEVGDTLSESVSEAGPQDTSESIADRDAAGNRDHDSAVGKPWSRTPLFSFGVNVYHTSFWPLSGVHDVVDRIARGNGSQAIQTLRFFLPTLTPAAEVWQREWLDETYAFIAVAARDPRIVNLLIVVGYGLDYHLSPDLRSLLPGDPGGYIRAVQDVVQGQVARVREDLSGSEVNICWQIENEMDIADQQSARPGLHGDPWKDDAFRTELMLALRDSVQEGWGAGDAETCIFVTYTPRSLGSREAYPWSVSSAHSFADSIDFIGLHYYWFELFPLDWWVKDVGSSIQEMAEKYGRPVMITETGVQLRTDDRGFVTSDEQTIMAWMTSVIGEMYALDRRNVPLLGLTYFKWCDADPASEDASGYQGYLGFFKFGGQWLGHTEKRFDDYPQEEGPWRYYTHIISAWPREE